MSYRRVLALLAVTLSFAVPAHADEGVGAGVQSGSVSGSSDLFGPGGVITGACWYAGQSTLTGQMQYQFGGAAAAYSTGPSLPELTAVGCTLTSPAQGLPGERPTLTASFASGCPVGSCASTSTVANWPVRPVVICVDGYAIFGPSPITTQSIVHNCKTTVL